jgi:hypothetical protein
MSTTQQSPAAGLRTWWAHQKQIPNRAALWMASIVMIVALLVIPPLCGAMADVATAFLFFAVVGVSYAWLKHRQKLLGRSGSLGASFRAAIIGALVLIPIIGTISLFTAVSTLNGLPSIFGFIGVLITVVPVLFMLGVIGLVTALLARRRSGPKPSTIQVMPAAATSGGQATPVDDPALGQLLGVLSNPTLLGQLFVNSGLSLAQKVDRKATASSTRRNGNYSNLDLAKDVVGLSQRLFGKKGQPCMFVDPNGNMYRVPQLLGTQYSNAGLLAYFDILPGFVTASYQKSAEAISTALGLPRGVTVTQTEDDVRNRRMRFHFRLSDPLAEVVPYDWNAPVEYTSIPFGVTDDGMPLTLGCLESNLILGGIPGGGKSGGLTTYITGLARLNNVAIVGLDPKRVEQGMWAPRFSWIGKDLDVMTDGLSRLTAEMDRRYVLLEEGGLKKVPVSWFPKMPLIAIVIDELAELVAMGISKEEKDGDTQRITHITRLVQKGRAAGIVLVSATQKPGGTTIPTSFRDLVAQRAAYATTNSDMTDTILGRGMSSNGGLSHEIAANEKGVCYIVNETSRFPVKARTYWIDDDDVKGIAERTSHLRVELPWMYEEADHDDLADSEKDDWAADIFAD